jgi:hypothetical protein
MKYLWLCLHSWRLNHSRQRSILHANVRKNEVNSCWIISRGQPRVENYSGRSKERSSTRLVDYVFRQNTRREIRWCPFSTKNSKLFETLVKALLQIALILVGNSVLYFIFKKHGHERKLGASFQKWKTSVTYITKGVYKLKTVFITMPRTLNARHAWNNVETAH